MLQMLKKEAILSCHPKASALLARGWFLPLCISTLHVCNLGADGILHIAFSPGFEC